MYSVQIFVPQPYPKGSVYDVLARYGGFLIRRSERQGRFDVDWQDEMSRMALLAWLIADARHIWDLLAELPAPHVIDMDDGDDDDDDDEDGRSWPVPHAVFTSLGLLLANSE